VDEVDKRDSNRLLGRTVAAHATAPYEVIALDQCAFFLLENLAQSTLARIWLAPARRLSLAIVLEWVHKPSMNDPFIEVFVISVTDETRHIYFRAKAISVPSLCIAAPNQFRHLILAHQGKAHYHIESVLISATAAV
jgi:hypothetical protein